MVSGAAAAFEPPTLLVPVQAAYASASSAMLSGAYHISACFPNFAAKSKEQNGLCFGVETNKGRSYSGQLHIEAKGEGSTYSISRQELASYFLAAGAAPLSRSRMWARAVLYTTSGAGTAFTTRTRPYTAQRNKDDET
jgi:hypothetical protein